MRDTAKYVLRRIDPHRRRSQDHAFFNTEDLVPTLPLPTIDNDPTSLGLLDTNIELVLKLFFKPSPFLFQHVDSPVALTYQLNTVADNHNLTQLYSRLG